MSSTKVKLTVGEQIDRYKDGRTQKWIVAKLVEMGNEISEVQFSNKKNGSDTFSDKEITDLSTILGNVISK